MEIELSLLEFAVSITQSIHAIEVSVLRDRIDLPLSFVIDSEACPT